MGLNDKFRKFVPQIRIGEVTGCNAQFTALMGCLSANMEEDDGICTPEFETLQICMDHENHLRKSKGSMRFQLGKMLSGRDGPKF